MKLRCGTVRDGRHIQPLTKLTANVNSILSIDVFLSIAVLIALGLYYSFVEFSSVSFPQDVAIFGCICKGCIVLRGYLNNSPSYHIAVWPLTRSYLQFRISPQKLFQMTHCLTPKYDKHMLEILIKSYLHGMS